jgi:hypothetical protein
MKLESLVWTKSDLRKFGLLKTHNSTVVPLCGGFSSVRKKQQIAIIN